MDNSRINLQPIFDKLHWLRAINTVDHSFQLIKVQYIIYSSLLDSSPSSAPLGMEYELVPKGQHRRNIAKKVIQTFKAHAIGVFSGIDPKCPLSLLDLMLKQVDCQVNLLRQANAAPKVSAYAYLHGQHDFNRHPFAPLGIEIHSYVQPNKRMTWEVKCKKGYYIGTSLEHYRYYFAHIRDTGGIQGSETMYFKHKYITMPTVTPSDAIVQAARTLIDALKAKVPPPLAQSGADQIKQLHAILTPDTSNVGKETEGDEESTVRPVDSPAITPVDIPAITPVDTPAITLADNEHISEGDPIDDEHDLPSIIYAYYQNEICMSTEGLRLSQYK